MNLMKNIRIIILLIFVVVSVALIAPNPFPKGVKVIYVSQNSTIKDISKGDIIYKINDADATAELIKKEYFDMVKLETSKGTRFEKVNGTLGLITEDVSSSNLNFGLDLKGGVRTVIMPVNVTNNVTITQVISTLQTRINIYGLREATFRPLSYQGKEYIEISIAGGTEEELRELLEREGKFEGEIPLLLDIKENKATIEFKTSHVITVVGNNTIFTDKQINPGGQFVLDNIPLVFNGIDNGKINLTSTVFTGNDIITVFFDPERSRIEKVQGGYKWFFSIKLSDEGAEKFASVTKNIPIAPLGPGQTDRYLESRIYLYLDEKLIDDLNIAAGLKGNVETEIMITGGAQTIDQAKTTKTKLQSILRSGALPASIEIITVESISPTLGEDFLRNAMIAGLGGILAVFIVVSVRYRRMKLVIPMLFVSLSEVVIILGMSVLIGWTIDLAAIAGIIAAIGTGIDSQIIILDETLSGEAKAWSLKEKIKRAFFIVFGAGGTIIAAMLPLMVLGFGLLRGFAITTIIGVLAGILITRPAYGAVVEKMTKE